MNMRPWIPVLSLLLAAGCGRDAPKGDAPAGGGHTHSHDAPHGGEIVPLGEDAGHAEILHDHDGGNMTVWILGPDAKTDVVVAAPEVQIAFQGKPVAVPLTAVSPGPDGRSNQWKGSHEALKADPWEGRIRVTIDGKTYQGPLEPPAHGH
jgi:hypothetical protein